ncbi:unnamed protein product [Linum trigynum]|uniref:Uncharacterized protein n=1 Tax=Linum trigynum TaxID=586398 RepID=A0AAV2GAX4_9ROSI
MKRFMPVSRRGRVMTGGGERKAGNSAMTIAPVDGNAMERPRSYPPRRPGVSAVKSWPPNCGRRRDLSNDGGRAPTVGIVEEEEEE